VQTVGQLDYRHGAGLGGRHATTLVLAAVLGGCSCTAAWAGATAAGRAPTGAAQTVRLTAGFSPERLGAGTTVSLGFQIAARGGEIPSPLTEVAVLYPAELGIGTSSLGLEACSPSQLQAEGLAGCPSNSLMGYGSALIEVPD
jgi:hypothetical protein